MLTAVKGKPQLQWRLQNIGDAGTTCPPRAAEWLSLGEQLRVLRKQWGCHVLRSPDFAPGAIKLVAMQSDQVT